MKEYVLISITLLIAIGLLVFSNSCAASEPERTLEEQAQEIYHSLMCPLCSGQTIDQSQNELSTQMRALVLEKLAQGETKEEILQFFVDRYGETVLAAPGKSGFNLIVWVTPVLGIFIGGIVLWIIIRRNLRGMETLSAEMPSLTPDDGQYRERLEKDLESFNEGGFR